MSLKRAGVVIIIVSILSAGTTPARAFTETAGNNFFGVGAGGATPSGGGNSFFGAAAGGSTTTGFNNSFFGQDAGVNNVGGSNNAFFGRSAGIANESGNENAIFGSGAGASNTSATSNSFFGRSAGALNSTGFENAFFGKDAGFGNTTGFENAFFGTSAGFGNTTGRNNVFFGTNAGLSNTTEDANSFIGAFANGEPPITNATALGYRAKVSQSNSLVLGSINGVNLATSDVKVGIGTDIPAEALHVRRDDGTAKVLVEEASSELLGRELFQLTNNGAARFRIRNSNNGATWDFQSSGGGGSFVIDRVGGPASLDFEIQPDGDAVHLGTVTAAGFVATSDRNMKTDITPAKASKLVTMLRELDISTWRFKDQPRGTVNLGPMAQDFHRLFGLGTETTIDVRDLAALALVAAQAQQKEIDGLKRVVADLSTDR